MSQSNHPIILGPAEPRFARRRIADSHDDRSIAGDVDGLALKRSSRQVAQTDDSASSGPAKRLESRCRIAFSDNNGPVGGDPGGSAVVASARQITQCCKSGLGV